MLTPEEILAATAHRPWPLPDKPWYMLQQWSDLLFAHWALPAEAVRPLVPPELELDLFDGQAWVAMTPFRMTHFQLRGVPPIPGVRDFLEMNLRTYVRLPASTSQGEASADGTKPGIWFFSLDASNLPAVIGARLGLGLPYFWAVMEAKEDDGPIHYKSRRKETTANAELRYTAGEPVTKKTDLEIFLTERYCLYEIRLGAPVRTQIQHVEWPLRHAQVDFIANSVGAAHGLNLKLQPDLVHFSKELDVLVFLPG